MDENRKLNKQKGKKREKMHKKEEKLKKQERKKKNDETGNKKNREKNREEESRGKLHEWTGENGAKGKRNRGSGEWKEKLLVKLEIILKVKEMGPGFSFFFYIEGKSYKGKQE